MPSSLKPNGKILHIPEQIIEDVCAGLALQFEVLPGPEGEMQISIYTIENGDLGVMPFGNRDIILNKKGEVVGGGTSMQGRCKPAWLTDLDEL